MKPPKPPIEVYEDGTVTVDLDSPAAQYERKSYQAGYMDAVRDVRAHAKSSPFVNVILLFLNSIGWVAR